PNGAPQGLDARAVAQRARQMALGRPAPVAVHDDGDVPGHGLPLAEVESRQLRALLRLPPPGAAVEHGAGHIQPVPNPSLTHKLSIFRLVPDASYLVSYVSLSCVVQEARACLCNVSAIVVLSRLRGTAPTLRESPAPWRCQRCPPPRCICR